MEKKYGYKNDGTPDLRFAMWRDVPMRQDGQPDGRHFAKGTYGAFGSDNTRQYEVVPSNTGFTEGKRLAIQWVQKAKADFEKHGADSKVMKAYHAATRKPILHPNFDSMLDNITNASLEDFGNDEYYGDCDTDGNIRYSNVIYKGFSLRFGKIITVFVSQIIRVCIHVILYIIMYIFN